MAVNTGNPELDRKIEDWLKWDKVCILKLDQSLFSVLA